jgi:hypothetical protein
MPILNTLQKLFTKLISLIMTTVKVTCTNGQEISIDVRNITGIYINGTTSDIFLCVEPYKITVRVDDLFLLLLTKYRSNCEEQSFTANKTFRPG